MGESSVEDGSLSNKGDSTQDDVESQDDVASQGDVVSQGDVDSFLGTMVEL